MTKGMLVQNFNGKNSRLEVRSPGSKLWHGRWTCQLFPFYSWNNCGSERVRVLLNITEFMCWIIGTKPIKTAFPTSRAFDPCCRQAALHAGEKGLNFPSYLALTLKERSCWAFLAARRGVGQRPGVPFLINRDIPGKFLKQLYRAIFYISLHAALSNVQCNDFSDFIKTSGSTIATNELYDIFSFPHLHKNFSICSSTSVKKRKACWNSNRICIKPIVQFGRLVALMVTSLPVCEHGLSLHLFRNSLISFCKV